MNVVIFRGKRFMQKKSLLAALVLVTVFGAGTVNAAEVFIKKNKTTTSAPQKQAAPSVPQGGVPNPGQEPVIPPSVQLYQQGVVPLGQQPCTEEDQKLVLALDKKVTAKRDPNATAGQVNGEAQQWSDSLNNPESMQNFINIYARCSSTVIGGREARGIKPLKPVEPVRLPAYKTP